MLDSEDATDLYTNTVVATVLAQKRGQQLEELLESIRRMVNCEEIVVLCNQALELRRKGNYYGNLLRTYIEENVCSQLAKSKLEKTWNEARDMAIEWIHSEESVEAIEDNAGSPRRSKGSGGVDEESSDELDRNRRDSFLQPINL